MSKEIEDHSKESSTMEFKEAFDKEVLETVSAFSNKKGGRIYIGVSDNGAATGIHIGKSTLNEWLNRISQGTDPRVVPHIEISKYKRKTIAIIEVAEHPLKPTSIKGRYYK